MKHISISLCGLLAIGLLHGCASKKPAAPGESTPPVAVAPPTPTPPQPPVIAADSATLSEGKSLYENSCGRCHKLFEPSAFTKEKWEPILARMQKKARLSDEEMAKVNAYVFSIAR